MSKQMKEPAQIPSHWPLTLMGGASSFLNIFVPLFLVRVLDVEHVGRYKVFFLYLSVMPWFLLTAGISNGLSHWAGHDSAARKPLFRASWTLLVSIVLIGFVLSLLITGLTYFFTGSTSKLFTMWSPTELAVFAWAAIVTILAPFFEDASVALGKVWRGAFFSGGFEFVRNIAILSSTLIFKSVLAVFIAHATVLSVKVLMGLVMGWREGFQVPSFNKADLKRVARYAIPVSFSAVFGILTNYVDQFVLAKWVEPATFAIYSIGCLTVPPLLIFEQAVNKVLIPKMAEAFQNQDSNRAAVLYRAALSEISWLMIPAAFGLFVFAEPIVLMLFTEKFRASIPFLQGYAFGFLAYSVPFDAVARARGNGRWILRAQIAFSSMALFFSLWFTHLYGAMGTLASVLLMKVIVPVITLRLNMKEQGWTLEQTIPYRDWARYGIVSFIFMAVAIALKSFFGSIFLWFFVCGGAAFALYVALTAPLTMREGVLRRLGFKS